MMKALVLLALLLPATAGSQTLYKCSNADGSKSYQQTPCSEAQRLIDASELPRESEKVAMPPPSRVSLPQTPVTTGSGSGYKPALTPQEEAKLMEEYFAKREPPAAPAPPPAPEPIITSINGKPVKLVKYPHVDQNGNYYLLRPGPGLDAIIQRDSKGVSRKCYEHRSGILQCREL